MARLRPALAALALATSAGCATGASPDGASSGGDQLTAGHSLAARHCAGCHAIEPAGDSNNPAAPPFRDLAQRRILRGLGDDLMGGLVSAHANMPIFHLDADEARDVVAYIEALQGSGPALRPRG